MAIRFTPSRQPGYVAPIVCREGSTKKGISTFEYGPDGAHFKTSHTADVWERLFKNDPDNDLVCVSLILWLEKHSSDFVTVEQGLEKLHHFLGEYLNKRKAA